MEKVSIYIHYRQKPEIPLLGNRWFFWFAWRSRNEKGPGWAHRGHHCTESWNSLDYYRGKVI
jgi:hypothetical protein